MKKPLFSLFDRDGPVSWRAGGRPALGLAGVMNLMARPIQPEKVFGKKVLDRRTVRP
jgi:hypothetical protein